MGSYRPVRVVGRRREGRGRRRGRWFRVRAREDKHAAMAQTSGGREGVRFVGGERR